MTLALTLIGTLLAGFALGIFLSRISVERSTYAAMLERRVSMLLKENADLQMQIDDQSRVELVDVIPGAPTVIRWMEWTRTVGDNVDEWERWDETDSWYVTVEGRPNGQWNWYAAFAPDAAKNGVSEDGISPSMADAQEAAVAWAEAYAANPAALKSMVLTPIPVTDAGQGDTQGES